MTAFRTYQQWLLHSNEAGVFRSALECSDAMPSELRGDVFEVIFRKSEAAWSAYQREAASECAA